ncbi:MAG TPA: molybdopterin synthase sulfur carrier subunit, partial [Marinobacter sp.]|nr:molybdopterin synthase sulfur carrier subunit [Marinobacter sp.]
MMTEPTLTVRFFARLREELDTDSLSLPATDGQTVDDL